MKMGLPSMFRSPSPRGFAYRPRYWDEEQERKEELRRLVEEARTGEVSDDRRPERMKQQIGARWVSKRSHRSGAGRTQSVRFLFIVAVLAGLVWLFLNWN